MGLLDGLIGGVMSSMLDGSQTQNPLDAIPSGLAGSNAGERNPLLQIVLSMLQQNGGLNGVLDKFRQGGMSAQADSWVGTGDNMAISPGQLQQVFGSSSIGSIASQLGMSHEQAGSVMSQILPELINQLTPQGKVPEDSNDTIAQGLEMLSKSLGK